MRASAEAPTALQERESPETIPASAWSADWRRRAPPAMAREVMATTRSRSGIRHFLMGYHLLWPVTADRAGAIGPAELLPTVASIPPAERRQWQQSCGRPRGGAGRRGATLAPRALPLKSCEDERGEGRRRRGRACQLCQSPSRPPPFEQGMEHMVYVILERQFQIILLIYQYRVTVKGCIDKFKKKVQNVSTRIEAV